MCLWPSLSAYVGPHLDFVAPSSRLRGEERVDVAGLLGCQCYWFVASYFFATCFTRFDGTSACNPAELPPVEPTRPH